MKRFLLFALLLVSCQKQVENRTQDIVSSGIVTSVHNIIYKQGDSLEKHVSVIKGDVVLVRLRVKKDLEWTVAYTCNEFQLLTDKKGIREKPDGWLPGDDEYQLFVFLVNKRGGKQPFVLSGIGMETIIYKLYYD